MVLWSLHRSSFSALYEICFYFFLARCLSSLTFLLYFFHVNFVSMRIPNYFISFFHSIGDPLTITFFVSYPFSFFFLSLLLCVYHDIPLSPISPYLLFLAAGILSHSLVLLKFYCIVCVAVCVCLSRSAWYRTILVCSRWLFACVITI